MSINQNSIVELRESLFSHFSRLPNKIFEPKLSVPAPELRRVLAIARQAVFSSSQTFLPVSRGPSYILVSTMEYPASEPERAQESLQGAPAPFLPFNNGAGHFSQSLESLPFSKAAQPALELSLTSAVNIAGVNSTSAGYNGQEMGLSDQFSGLNGARTTFLQSPTNAPQPPKRSEGMQYLPPGPLGNGTDGRNMPLYSYSYTQNQTQGIGFAGGAPQLRRLV